MSNHSFYDRAELMRFISYYNQLSSVFTLAPKNVLEIGVGDGVVSTYLKNKKIAVTTCDISPKLNPDCVADVRKLPFKDNSFDLILICEVLEHIPFKDLDIALAELYRVTKKHVIFSVPYSRIYFSVTFIFPFIKRIFRKEIFNVFVGMPSHSKIGSGSHKWEIGRRGYPIQRIRKHISIYFRTLSEKRAVLHPVHYFFILEKYIDRKPLSH
jgi:ubiquinone/menaquinone biosynthesis C-methylase UbiE